MKAEVTTFHRLCGGLVRSTTGLQKILGEMESDFLSKHLKNTPITKPVFVTSLARSGTTILLEIFNRHPELTSHRYSDYPFLFTPYLWNKYVQSAATHTKDTVERSHKDGLMVNADSPEAFEELLWLAYFSDLHGDNKLRILDAKTRNPDFEEFYTNHIKKLLLVRNASRYLCKANYHISRIEYLLKLFPDARFIIPVRKPEGFVASSQKQHQLFLQPEFTQKKMQDYLSHVGHFEFGALRSIMNFLPDQSRLIEDAWDNNEDIKGWALYWKATYDWLFQLIEDNPTYTKNIKLISYESFCENPTSNIKQVYEFCSLSDYDPLNSDNPLKISAPSYYNPDLSESDLELITEITNNSYKKIQSLFN